MGVPLAKIAPPGNLTYINVLSWLPNVSDMKAYIQELAGFLELEGIAVSMKLESCV